MTDPLAPTPPPAGISRKQRRMWEEYDEVRRHRVAASLGVEPPKLSRAARREVEAEERVAAQRAREEERAANAQGRARGLLIVAAIIAVAVVVGWLWPHDPAPAVESLPPVTVTNTPPHPTAPTVVGAGSDASLPAVAAAAAWWKAACGTTPAQWDALRPLMTDAAFQEAVTTPPPVVPVNWLCLNQDATPASGVRSDGTVVVELTGTRTVTNPDGAQFAEPAADRRVMVPAAGGWLVGTNPAG